MATTAQSDRARALVHIGEDAIARENPAALRAYFAEDFVFHGPGYEADFDGLVAFFAAMRAAFPDLTVTRPEIIEQDDMVAARTVMAGTFTNVFTQSPIGPLQPTGRPMRMELSNQFRFNADGRLAEEWATHDTLGFLRQLGVEMAPAQGA